MPYPLTPIQRLTAQALLLAKTPHTEVASEVNCSIQQVKKMSSNFNKYGSVVAPALLKRGRPSILNDEMRAVYSFPSLVNIY